MGTVTAADILSTARSTLLDVASTAWSQQDLLDYLNQGLRACAGAKPDFYTVKGNVELVAGPEQALPADGVQVLDILENAYSGEVVTLVDRELIDETNRFWPVTDRSRDAQHYAVDPRDPARFTVMPPNDGTGEVRALYGALHPTIALADINDALLVSDKFQPVLVSYVLHRAYAKNSQRQDLAKSSFYKQQWAADLGLDTRAQAALAPRATPQGNKP